MSAGAMGWVYENSPYKGADFLIHLALADSANDMHSHELWASQTWISKKARVTRQTVNKFLLRAVEDGFLVILQDNARARKPNRYRLVMPSDTPQAWSPHSEWDDMKDQMGHVATDDMSQTAHVATDDMHMSPEPTCHVATGDTNPREPNPEPNHTSAPPPATPSEPRVLDDSGLDQAPTASDDRASSETGSRADETDDPQTGRARELCDLLALKVAAEHGHRPKVTDKQWVQPMDLLLRRGSPEWGDPEPVPPEKVNMMIEYVYTYGAEPGNFRWADQIRSPQALRRHWDKLRAWANQEHTKRNTPEAPGATNQGWMVRSTSHG